MIISNSQTHETPRTRVVPIHLPLVAKDEDAFRAPSGPEITMADRVQSSSPGCLPNITQAWKTSKPSKLIQKREPSFGADCNIAVVGAGPGGLAAADFLKTYGGYHNVTVLESSDHVGGRVQSYQVQDSRGELIKGKDGRPLVYEQGAVMGASSYKELELLLRHSNIETELWHTSTQYLSTKTGGPVDVLSLSEKMKLPLEGIWYIAKSVLAWRKAFRPGFDQINQPELNQSVAETLESKIPAILKVAAGPVIGFGYGQSWKDTSLAGGLKYLRPRQILGNRIYRFPQGFQKLFQDVAQNHQVLTNCSVNSVRSNGQKLLLETALGPMQFDKVIWTAPLQHAAEALQDIPPGLKAKMQDSLTSVRYWSVFCRINGLPAGKHSFFFVDNLNENGANRPLLIYNPHPEDENIAVVYSIAAGDADEQQILNNIREDVAAVHGEVVEVIEKKCWDYYPHAEPGKLDVYKDINAFQGTKGVYLAGAGMEFDTTNDAVRASGVVVNDHFLIHPPAKPRSALREMFAHEEMQTLPRTRG